MIEFIKKRSKALLIIGFALVFTSAFYISIVGAGVIITNPETAIKASLLKTLSGKPVEFKIGGSLNSIGLLPESDQELMSMILDDLVLDATITYDQEVNAIDFAIGLRSISYGESILEIGGYSADDRVYFSENKVLKGNYYFLTEPFTGEGNMEELLDELLQDVTRVGLKEYTTTTGDKSYANVFEVRSDLDGQEVFMEVLVNNKMEIVHLHLVIESDGENVIDVEADTRNVDRDLLKFDASDAQLFDIQEIVDLIPEM